MRAPMIETRSRAFRRCTIAWSSRWFLTRWHADECHSASAFTSW